MRIELDKIKTTFYVRVQVDQERVDFFHELMLSGKEFPPIDVMPGDFPGEYELLDGRSRRQAADDLGESDIECKVHKRMSLQDAMAFALKANYGGSMPPSEEDFIHFADVLIKQKMSKETILKAMSVLPVKIATNFYNKAKDRIAVIMVSKAIEYTVKYGISDEEAHDRVSKEWPCRITVAMIKSEKNRRLISHQGAKGYYANMKSDIGKRFRLFTKANKKMFEALYLGYSRGECKADKVKEILGHFGDLLCKTINLCQDQQSRFEFKSFEFKAPLFQTTVTTRSSRRRTRKAMEASA